MTLRPYLPALAVAATAGYSANFPTAGRLGAEVVTLVVLLTLAWFGSEGYRDPLALARPDGRGPLALPWLLVLAVAASFALSPVPRAGLGVVLRLPLYLLVPAAVSRCWRAPGERRRGTLLMAVVLASVSGFALFQWWHFGDPRPALPLGHHNLLALWLVTVVPLVVWPLWATGSSLGEKAVSLSATLLALATLVATRSLGGALGVLTFLATLTWVWRRAVPVSRTNRRILGAALLAAGLVLVPLLPRLGEIAAGTDLSVSARLAYAEAALEGAAARPWTGWGPGAAAWTVAEFFDPEAGTHPPGQVLSDLHSVALQVPYELGVPATALLLACAGLWLRRRVTDLPRAAPAVATAVAGTLGWAATLAVSGVFGVEALWLAGAVLVGAARWQEWHEECREQGREPADRREGYAEVPPFPVSFRGTMAVRLLCMSLVMAHLPLLDAMRHHALARCSEARRVDALAAAAALDPLPLYEAQYVRAAIDSDGSLDVAEAERSLTEAATSARGVAALWLAAGVGSHAETSAVPALERACALEPLGAMAPFFRYVAEPEHPDAARFAARAVLLEPRLLASVALAPGPLSEIGREIEEWPALPPGWREEMTATVERIAALPLPQGDAETVDLALSVDSDPATSMSLFVFGRQPLPQVIARVRLIRNRLEEIDLPSAGRLSEAAGAFRSHGCGR